MNENWYVFCISIIKGMTPEQSFNLWQGLKNPRNSVTYTKEDVEDMKRMRDEKMTYKVIGEIYGISDTAIYRRIHGYKKDRPAGTETVRSPYGLANA